jgi:hypothetical protein
MANGILRHRTYFEGDDDGSVLRALAGAGLLPQDLEVVRTEDRRKNPGKDGLVKDIAALINPAGGAGLSAVAVRDVDDLSADQIREWFVQRMTAELPATTPPIQVFPQAGTSKAHFFHVRAEGIVHIGRAVVVSVGLPGGLPATEYGIAQFAIDDFVLLLARAQATYDAIDEFKGVTYDLAWKKLSEIADLMTRNGIPIKHKKRLMHVFRAVTGFRASPAAFAD